MLICPCVVRTSINMLFVQQYLADVNLKARKDYRDITLEGALVFFRGKKLVLGVVGRGRIYVHAA